MTDDASPDIEAHAAPGPGVLLRMAREARGTTVAEVAAALKLSPRQIEAIENEDFSRLSGATFIRGFVRNYAKLLKIDAGPLLVALEDKTVLPVAVLSAPVDVGVKMPNANGRQGRGYLAATLLALCMLGVALASYFDLIDFRLLLPAQNGSTAAAKPEVIQPQVVQPVTQTTVAAQPAASAEPSEEASKQVGTAEEPAKDAAMRQMVFSFDGNSWVEVKDISGRIIFSQMNPKGTTQVVEGRPPFHLVVGNASNVRLQYNDQPVDLRPHTRVEVARLTLE